MAGTCWTRDCGRDCAGPCGHRSGAGPGAARRAPSGWGSPLSKAWPNTPRKKHGDERAVGGGQRTAHGVAVFSHEAPSHAERPTGVCRGTLRREGKDAGGQGRTAPGDEAMKSAALTNWIVLLLTVALTSAGCAHTQQPERRSYVIDEDASGVGSNTESGTGGSGADAYCNEIQKQCFTKCWRRKPEIQSIPKGSGSHYEYCTTRCRKEFDKCTEEQAELERQESQRKELHFPTIDAALVWLREHKTEVAIGTVVIVAGAVAAPYAIAVMGGALVLAPL